MCAADIRSAFVDQSSRFASIYWGLSDVFNPLYYDGPFCSREQEGQPMKFLVKRSTSCAAASSSFWWMPPPSGPWLSSFCYYFSGGGGSSFCPEHVGASAVSAVLSDRQWPTTATTSPVASSSFVFLLCPPRPTNGGRFLLILACLRIRPDK